MLNCLEKVSDAAKYDYLWKNNWAIMRMLIMEKRLSVKFTGDKVFLCRHS